MSTVTSTNVLIGTTITAIHIVSIATKHITITILHITVTTTIYNTFTFLLPGLQVCIVITPDFLLYGCWGSNYGPHASMKSMLLMEP